MLYSCVCFYADTSVSVHLLVDCTFEFVYFCLFTCPPPVWAHSSLEEHAVRCALSSPPEVARRAVQCIGKLTVRNMSMEKLFEVHTYTCCTVHVIPIATEGSLHYVLVLAQQQIQQTQKQ